MNPALPRPATARVPSLWTRLWHGYRKLHAAPDWASFAGNDWAERIMSEEVTDRLHQKQGRSIARWTLSSADGRQLVVYLKRHYRLPRLDGWKALLFPCFAWSPGLQEWQHLHRAAELGLPVPRPVAAGEFVGRGGRLQSFLAVDELSGMLALHEAIPLAQQRLNPTAFVRWKQSLVIEMARLTHLLHDRSYYHKDLYLCHFYIHEDDTRAEPADWKNRVVVIDLHRLARHRLTGLWWKVKDLGQLLYSSEIEGVDARDQLAFWRAYAGKRRSNSLLARMIRKKWRLYRTHNLKKEAGKK
jgi:Lipopolysaccharide kinase (Kdo/WaaP) family